MWRYVRARVPDHEEAEDLTGEVFSRALRAWDRYDPSRGAVGAWLAGIAHHVVTDWWRRNRRDGLPRQAPVGIPREESEPVHGHRPPEPEAAALREDVLRELRAGIGTLSEREREALALRFGAELSAREVGEVLGISEGAAKMLVHRAVKRLRTVIASD